MRRWPSVSTSGGAAPASGVAGLKAVAVAESTNLLSGEQPKGDKMGEYIASRGGSLPIRKVIYNYDCRSTTVLLQYILYMGFILSFGYPLLPRGLLLCVGASIFHELFRLCLVWLDFALRSVILYVWSS